MPWKDYRAPGVSVIIERQQGEETSTLTEFYPVFIGTGMTSNSRVIPFNAVTADISAFPKVTFEVDFTGIVSKDLYLETTFSLTKFQIDKTISPATGPKTTLVKDTDYAELTMVTQVREDGKASLTVSITKTGITATDLTYSFEITAQNTADDFDLRLVRSEDVFYAKTIVGPYILTENGVSFLNDIAIAAEIAFRSKVPAFYYLEIPRAYGVPAVAADYAAILEKVYYQPNAYRLIPLTSDAAVTTALKSFITSMANPLDKRETVGFVSYRSSDFVNIKDLVELKTKVGGLSASLNTPRICNVFGCSTVEMLLDDQPTLLPEYFMNAAVASLDASLNMADPLSRREITVFTKINGPRFRPKQWNDLAAERVWIVTQDTQNSPIEIRHQLTTSQSDAPEDQEYSLVKNLDAVTRLLRERLSPYAGKYNIAPGYMEKLDATLTSAIEEAKEKGIANEITVISPWALRKIPTDSGNQVEKRNLVTRLKLVPPYPANNLDVVLVI